MYRYSFRAMGCHIHSLLDSQRAEDAGCLDALPGWFAAWEQTCSRFLPDSELSHLNRHAGEPIALGDDMWSMLVLAIAAAEWSGGLVTPTVLSALEAAGYDRSFADLPTSMPSYSPVPTLPQSHTTIYADQQSHTVQLPEGMRLDLGGIAKGWAAEQAMQRLAPIAPTLIDAGGDIAISAPQHDGSPWPIGVGDPYRPGHQRALLRIAQGGVATSGRDYRRWQRGKQSMHHLIDPRTGAPAQTDLQSVTIVAPTTVMAEVAAKVVMILGSEDGQQWLATQPHLHGLLIDDTDTMLLCNGMQHLLWHIPESTSSPKHITHTRQI